jgi:hypothetical protein
MTHKTIRECCICRQYSNYDTPKIWYYPSVADRQRNYNNDIRLSHTNCPECNLLYMEKNFTRPEIDEMLNNLEEKLK